MYRLTRRNTYYWPRDIDFSCGKCCGRRLGLRRRCIHSDCSFACNKEGKKEVMLNTRWFIHYNSSVCLLIELQLIENWLNCRRDFPIPQCRRNLSFFTSDVQSRVVYIKFLIRIVFDPTFVKMLFHLELPRCVRLSLSFYLEIWRSERFYISNGNSVSVSNSKYLYSWFFTWTHVVESHHQTVAALFDHRLNKSSRDSLG